MGPSAFRIAGLGERLTALGIHVVDAGDLVAPIPETKTMIEGGLTKACPLRFVSAYGEECRAARTFAMVAA